MDVNNNQVFTKNYKQNYYKQINVEHVYLTIPYEYVCVYHKLLIALADLGKNIMDNCSYVCNNKNNTIINCWNMFQSAIACKELNRDKEADLFIDYINKQLNYIYKGINIEQYCGKFPVSITEDGQLKAIVTCNSDTIFEVDSKTGVLYEKYINNIDNNKVYTIDDNGNLLGYNENEL